MKDYNKAKEILDFLQGKGYSVSLAESCTGGLLADAFVSVDGASASFLGGLVCYSAKAKVELAGVSEGAAYENFAINENCSKEFALGALKNFNSNIAISTTGFAEDGKIMYLSIATVQRVETFKEVFYGSRNDIRRAQVDFALSKLLGFIKLF